MLQGLSFSMLQFLFQKHTWITCRLQQCYSLVHCSLVMCLRRFLAMWIDCMTVCCNGALQLWLENEWLFGNEVRWLAPRFWSHVAYQDQVMANAIRCLMHCSGQRITKNYVHWIESCYLNVSIHRDNQRMCGPAWGVVEQQGAGP